MKIGFDAKRAVFNMTGLGNYSRTLIRGLATHYPNDEYFLYSPGTVENPRLDFLTKLPHVRIVGPKGLYSGPLKSLWRSLGICGDIKRDQIELFHGLSNELPFGLSRVHVAKMVTIHDLIFKRFPHYYPTFDRRIYDFKSRYACRTADIIIAVSEQTKSDIIEYYGIAPEKVKVAYQSCDPSFSRAIAESEKSDVRSRYNLPTQFVLYVGSIEERKNLLGLVEAISLLRKSHDLFLVAIGRGSYYLEKVRQAVNSSGMNDRIQIRADIAFADFPAIYQMAQAFVYPSHFEGFGIPVIEALWSKTPVITSRGGCFAEAAGPGSVYVSPDNSEEIASAIAKVLGDSNLRARMIGSGYSHVQKFREENTTGQVMALYRSIVKK